MVGGGPGSNIGEAHRYAARYDDRYALLTGVFASDADRSRDFAATLGLEADRRYGSWQEMAEQESRRTDGIEVGSQHYDPQQQWLSVDWYGSSGHQGIDPIKGLV